MKRNLNSKEKLLVFIKRTKKKNSRYIMFLLPIIIVILIGSTWFERTQSVKKVKLSKGSELTMTMVGDIMMGRYVNSVVEQHGTEYVFRYVSPYFKNSDYVSGNFDQPVLLKEEKEYKKADEQMGLHTNENVVKMMKEQGFTLFNLANTNMMDYGKAGLTDTLKTLKKEKINAVGAGKNLESAKHIAYQEINGIRVATVGFTDAYSKKSNATDKRAGVLTMDPDLLFELIGKAKDPSQGNADLVVVNASWGQEYDSEPSPRQEKLGRAMIDAGADIIIGHHPHVLQSVEVYKQGIIFYSLGNFVFDQGWTKTKDSALVQYNLGANGQAKIEIVPLIIKEGTPRPAASWLDKRRIYQELTKYTPSNVLVDKKQDKFEILINHKHVLEHKENRNNAKNDAEVEAKEGKAA
ncbi:poly-gamma-glutamate synthesis protein (capsule biosynthesis protein) [Bacillus sp. RC242]|uniref:CapA family protein n=1 Tax=Bacillus sp. RC242 TaxID=3156286 RepID=UPI003832C604